jgi:hypothetical protein
VDVQSGVKNFVSGLKSAEKSPHESGLQEIASALREVAAAIREAAKSGTEEDLSPETQSYYLDGSRIE